MLEKMPATTMVILDNGPANSVKELSKVAITFGIDFVFMSRTHPRIIPSSTYSGYSRTLLGLNLQTVQ